MSHVSTEIHRMIALASRCKTRIKTMGVRGLTDASEDEIKAMAFVCDQFLEDYTGPLGWGEPDLSQPTKTKLEAAE